MVAVYRRERECVRGKRDTNRGRRRKYGPETQDSICARKFGLHTYYTTKVYSSKLIARHNLSSWI